MKKTIYLVFVAIMLSHSAWVQAKENCENADSINYVMGGSDCLKINTVNAVEKPQALVVLIHADVSRGGPSDYFYKHADRLNPEANNFTVVSLIRPGYFDSEGNRSSGKNYNRRDSYTNRIVDNIADAIKKLKEKYQPNKLVVVGHSGGAAITGNIIGRHPSVVDAAVLVACPCNIAKWRRGRRAWKRSKSPVAFAKKVKDTQVVTIAGTADNATAPYLMQEYIEKLKANGIDASMVLVEGAGHSSVVKSDAFVNEILKLAK